MVLRTFCLNVVSIQLSIDETVYESAGSFHNTLSLSMDGSAGGKPDLVVFPEYTCVFAALIPFHNQIRQTRSLEDGFILIQKDNPEIKTLKDLFVLASPGVEDLINQTFGELARKHQVWILGGTYFKALPGADETWELKNRAFLMNPGGSIVYEQDKVFLTDFEQDVVHLTPGGLAEVETFSVDGARIGLTICRDTYETVWQGMFEGCDLWIDIKANGQQYTAETRRSFYRALPNRISHSNVEYGLTVCLNGRFLDLFWEGKSSLVHRVTDHPGKEIAYVWEAPRPDQTTRFSFNLRR